MDNIPLFKVCSKCGEEKAITEFHKGNKYKGGRRAQCKKCAHKQVGNWQKKNPEKAKATRLKHYWGNVEEIRLSRRRRPADWKPKTKQEIIRKYFLSHKHKYKANALLYKQRHPDRVKAKKVIRHAREKGAKGYASPKAIQARMEMFGNRCWICGGEYDTVDHVIPISKGGTNWPANLRPACRSCNSRKNSRNWRLFTKNRDPA